ncbi:MULTISPECIES: hypothetical protein [unclassified Streptomyces]|uniref:hypothetical protein n=1 Tax=unclassified Streptomyces TaxID=2593676 RepID=UPI002ED1C5E0|nr:hypothetical protein OH827_25300 [Streptomyces sp. NBC_00891]WSY08123.1 hypothetical protein OG464_25300 [Streptomyces sp. NBC_00890]WSZ09747.1 hypothetical protein OG704_25305 [Streptomyces sp. NBC_00869]WSZ22752.1 hypothetical protein OG498_08265 [Streptomyces sp. NBC_00870]
MTATSGRGRGRLGFGPVGPRRRRYTIGPDQLDSLTLPVGDDGVVIGEDERGLPAVLGLNRPSAYDITLVGGLWTVQVLALRAAATGARIVVETGRTPAWTGLARAVGDGCVALHEVGRVPPPGASAASPVVVVRDCGMRPPPGRAVPGPWRSVVTLLPYLGPAAPGLLEKASMAGVQRVSPEEAEQVGHLMRLPAEAVRALPSLEDGATLWCTQRESRLVTTRPTDAESGLLGAARRLD